MADDTLTEYLESEEGKHKNGFFKKMGQLTVSSSGFDFSHPHLRDQTKTSFSFSFSFKSRNKLRSYTVSWENG